MTMKQVVWRSGLIWGQDEGLGVESRGPSSTVCETSCEIDEICLQEMSLADWMIIRGSRQQTDNFE